MFEKIINSIFFKKFSKITRNYDRLNFTFIVIVIFGLLQVNTASAAQLKAGVSKLNITNTESGKFIKDSAFVRALVFNYGKIEAVIISIDLMWAEDSFVENIRLKLYENFNIKPENVLINASHLHESDEGSNIELRTILAVKNARQNMFPVTVGVGTGYEDRIMENRRLKLKNGKSWTIRHSNPLPPDEEVTGIGTVDPEIGILRLDKKNGETLAVVYNFASHTYQGVSNTGTTVGYPGFASKVIEDNLDKGTIALFIQGACGDVIPILYKDVYGIRDQELLGNTLVISILDSLKKIETGKGEELKIINEVIKLPRRTDLSELIESLENEQANLLQSLRGMSLNLKTFIPLYIKYNLYEEYPSYYSHRYLHNKMTGRDDMAKLDVINRRNIDKYLRNIYSMEKLARIQDNLTSLKSNLEKNEISGEKTIDIEVQAMRINEFVVVTFPGDLVVQIGLNIKKMSPHQFSFIAGHSNGVVGYGPTVEYYNGDAYEDLNCLLAPEWQKIYEDKVMDILNRL